MDTVTYFQVVPLLFEVQEHSEQMRQNETLGKWWAQLTEKLVSITDNPLTQKLALQMLNWGCLKCET